MLQAVCFDLDRTLVRSDDAHVAAFNEILAPIGCRVSTEIYATDLFGKSDQAIFRLFFRDSKPEDIKVIARKKAEAYLAHTANVVCQDGAIELLETLRTRGLRLALVTNAPAFVARDVAQLVGLRGYFEAVITGDDVHEEKPAPAPYLAALETLRLDAASAVAVEDSPAGIQSAIAAGMRAVQTVNQPWSSMSVDGVVRINSLREVASLIGTLRD